MTRDMEDFHVKRILAGHQRRINDAMIEVGLAGGGKVVVPIVNPRLEVLKVLAGGDESHLPRGRVEHIIPPNVVFHG